MKKFDKNKYKEVTLTISIDDAEEEKTAKSILKKSGECWGCTCRDCPFCYKENMACTIDDNEERMRIVKAMGVEA